MYMYITVCSLCCSVYVIIIVLQMDAYRHTV